MAGLFSGISPYQFAYNNPIYFNDPTGLAAVAPSKTSGNDDPLRTHSSINSTYYPLKGVESSLGLSQFMPQMPQSQSMGKGLPDKLPTPQQGGSTVIKEVAKRNRWISILGRLGSKILGVLAMVLEPSEMGTEDIPNPNRFTIPDTDTDRDDDDEPVNYLYRGDSRPPSEIIADGGFIKTGNNYDLMALTIKNQNNSAYISTSRSEVVALKFANYWAMTLPKQTTYIYYIKNNGTGIDVNAYFAAHGKTNPYADQQEIAFKHIIPLNFVKGYRIVRHGKIISNLIPLTFNK